MVICTTQDGPSLTYGQALKVSEGQSARMSTSVTSNPASNVSWSRDNLLVSTQQSVNGTTRYTIQKTQCTDTGPFQVVASNGVQSKQATKVFLYVYCAYLVPNSSLNMIWVLKYIMEQVRFFFLNIIMILNK